MEIYMPSHQPFLGRVLLVDDDEDIRNILEANFVVAGFLVTSVGSLTEAKQSIHQCFYDALLVDVFLGEEDGLDIIPDIVEQSPYSKIFMMSAHGTVDVAVNAMQEGAASFISKTKNADDVVERVKQGLNHTTKVLETSFNGSEFGIVGESSPIQKVLQQIDQVRNVSSNILIVGPSGSGKELVARAIHETSDRRQHRFAAINCGAIPANLLESELFGHKKGAFTDARTDRKGIFEACNQGTLLLDEIGEMPIELQVKLLRVLQEREVTPVGSTNSIKINTRVIGATNRNPIDEIKAGTMREDLYYRLSVITIELPSLRERRSDIPLLVEHFIRKMNERFHQKIQPPSQELQARLISYSWPGNIRELQNFIERGAVLSRDGQLHLDDMFQSLNHKTSPGKEEAKNIDDEIFQQPLSDAKMDFEREYLKQLLEMTRGNISEMARISKRYRADIYRLLAKHGLEWDEFRGTNRSNPLM